MGRGVVICGEDGMVIHGGRYGDICGEGGMVMWEREVL